MITEYEARSLVERILKFAEADETEVSISSGTTAHLRFARNTPSTSGQSTNTVIAVRSTFGTRSGMAQINQLDDDALRNVVNRSEELARLAPEDPEFMPALGPQGYPKPNSWVEETAHVGTEGLAPGAEQCIRDAAARGLVAAGFLRVDANAQAIGNSSDLFGYHRSTIASLSETVRTNDGGGSGWVSRAANDLRTLDFKELSAIAVEKALRSVKPQRLEPGRYPTILEPSCVADMVRSLLFSMDARSADEGRSYFARKEGDTKVGEKTFSEIVHIFSDPLHPIVPGFPWGEDGLPQKRVEWITGGVVKTLHTSRYWAKKQNREAIPFPSNVLLTGGNGTLQDLISSTKRGILVTSLWYIRSVDPQTLLLTGLTRDGVFWIEDGEIAHPVMNFRWNESPAAVLQNIEAMSQSVRVPPRESRNETTLVPAVRVGTFNFSSLSDAI
jgi:predicted Zn-dependent protease